MYISHKIDDKREPVKDHLIETAKLAKEFAEMFGAGLLGYALGISHDIGKYSKEYLERIEHNGAKCDHSTASAKFLIERYKDVGKFLGMITVGHHSGLLDYGSSVNLIGTGTYLGRLKKEIPDFSAHKGFLGYEDLPDFQLINLKSQNKIFAMYLLSKMLFSCLVDADYLATEIFMKSNSVKRGITTDYNELFLKIETTINSFTKDTYLNIIRSKIAEQCIQKAFYLRGIFSLTVPTGAGKTLASMAFAIKHLLESNKVEKNKKIKRIIYVIPYTTIIEQNAKVFSDLFEEKNVLQHHSNFVLDEKDDDFNIKKLAAENYDAPIIITTNVQFFESLYSAKTSKSRKLHNIVNSIIVFDEVQMLPGDYLKPCLAMIDELISDYNCSAVFCSATQPNLNKFLYNNVIEICDNTDEIYNALNRTEIHMIGKKSIEMLSNEISKLNQVLVIVNTKSEALDLFENCNESEDIYHLSTFMCPIHRREIIEVIREKLNNKKPCKVISTSLIEAGVDLDFPYVYRALSGLDSIIQAAGRCNREGQCNIDGKLTKGQVYVFEFTSNNENGKINQFKEYLLRRSLITNDILKEYSDIFTPGAIKSYYDKLYFNLGEKALDYKDIVTEISNSFNGGAFAFDFASISDKFKMIDENDYSIIIKYNDDAKKLIKILEYSGLSKKLLRRLQQYTVNLKKYLFDELCQSGKILKICDNSGILKSDVDMINSTSDYGKAGVKIKEKMGMGIFK